LRKAKERSLEWGVKDKQEVDLNLKEKELVKLIRDFATIVQEAGRNFSPALIANYTFELVKEYNQFYHDFSILREENQAKRNFRLCLSEMAGRVIESGMNLLGIEVPERM
jgi:arginyl-tRNA synthetase